MEVGESEAGDFEVGMGTTGVIIGVMTGPVLKVPGGLTMSTSMGDFVSNCGSRAEISGGRESDLPFLLIQLFMPVYLLYNPVLWESRR